MSFFYVFFFSIFYSFLFYFSSLSHFSLSLCFKLASIAVVCFALAVHLVTWYQFTSYGELLLEACREKERNFKRERDFEECRSELVFFEEGIFWRYLDASIFFSSLLFPPAGYFSLLHYSRFRFSFPDLSSPPCFPPVFFLSISPTLFSCAACFFLSQHSLGTKKHFLLLPFPLLPRLFLLCSTASCKIHLSRQTAFCFHVLGWEKQK